MKLADKITKNLNNHNLWIFFQDFVEIMAISISNVFDKRNSEEREKRYLEIIKKYDKDELLFFSEIFSEIVMEMESNPRDILGELYMQLGLGDKWSGQFFTAYSVADVMARLTFDEDRAREDIKKYGYISLNEPSVGGGVTIIAFANLLKEKGINYQDHLFVLCNDIDSVAVHMAYIQLSLLGIPAVVRRQNTITLELFDEWKTPFYYLKFFENKLNRKVKQEDFKFKIDDENQLTMLD